MLHNKRKIILAFVIICLTGLVGLGISYACWKFTYIQTDNNIAISKCLKLEMSNESNAINLDNMYPISDEEGKKLTPYSFKITNTCFMSAEYKVNLEMLEGTTLNSKYLASLVNNGDIKLLSSYDSTKTTISGSVESRTLDTNILTPGASKEYSISLWMDKSVTLADDAQNKSFSAKVVIDASMYTGIVDKIVAQLDTSGKCPTVNDDGTVNVTGAESENSLLCSAPDNYGTSYYYRGNVINNYVKFANFYWRIVRINGDGSVRMIYDGTSAHANGENSDDRIIGTNAFNENADDNAYVGYMYGTPGSSTYEETHANINDSTIKKYIDIWYENSLKNTEYEKCLTDNIFCNDRTVSNYRETYKNLGYGTENTYYRWAYGPWADAKYENKYVKLVCNSIRDSFGLSNYDYGNGALTYTIALLSFDEATLAGGWNVANINYYLSNNAKQWWLMSAVDYYGGASATIGGVSSNGVLGIQNFVVGNRVNKIDGVKPVINLKPNSLKSGDGTINNPYVVE